MTASILLLDTTSSLVQTCAQLTAVARPASKAKAKRSEAKGGNLTADGWPWLYSTQPALEPAQRVNVERSLTPRLANLLYTWAHGESTRRRPNLPTCFSYLPWPSSSRPGHPVHERDSWYFDVRCARARALLPDLRAPRFDFLPICANLYIWISNSLSFSLSLVSSLLFLSLSLFAATHQAARNFGLDLFSRPINETWRNHETYRREFQFFFPRVVKWLMVD